jgi:hypothetical protein
MGATTSFEYATFSCRYPSFIDAVRDLDDCLSLCFLFATFPKTRNVQLEQIRQCRRLTGERPCADKKFNRYTTKMLNDLFNTLHTEIC